MLTRKQLNELFKNDKYDSYRIKHEECTTENKDPALVITKTPDGWVWICHRCRKNGFISSAKRDPQATVRALKQDKPVINMKMKKIDLPEDCISIIKEIDDRIPSEVYQWLFKYNLNSYLTKYDFKWSPSYSRIIIPIYDNEDTYQLIGWVGRDVSCSNKSERETKKIPKYINRRKKGSGRLLYLCKGDNSKMVIVEDIISAICVHEATGYTTIALLTTSIDQSIIKLCKYFETFVWLDADAATKSVSIVVKLSSHGVNARYVYTTKDPKDYSFIDIAETLNKKETIS